MIVRLSLALASILATGAASAAGTSTSFGIGADYSSGDYGSDVTTDIFSVPVSATVTNGSWRFRGSLPWIRVSGDPNVLPTLGAIDNRNPIGRGRGGSILNPGDGEPTQSGTASGLGDLLLDATYTVPTGNKLGVDVGVDAKIATADEDKGLGTGSNDYGVTVDLYREFNGTMLFGGIGHTRLGTSEFIDVDGINTGNLGISQMAGSGRVGAMVEFRSATVSGLDDRRDLIGFFSLPASGGKFQLYASRGLSDSSPDWGVGVAISSGN